MSNNNQKRLPQLTLPKLPTDLARATNRPSEQHKSYRASYDWKAYDPEALVVMEKYWDEFIKVYNRLLPERIRSNPGSHRGVNLGTYNGAYQKAWMRIGYNMFGVEYVDTEEELREYGCEGIQASFFNMSRVADDSFDFAIMDRAFFLKKTHAYSYCSERQKYFEIGDGSDHSHGSSMEIASKTRARRAPKFFSETLRVLKNDGVFFAMFYPHWSSAALRELFAEGEITLWQIKGGRRYLGLMLDRSKPPTQFLTAEELISQFRPGKDVIKMLNRHMYVGDIVETEDKLIKFHYLLTNQLILIDRTSSEILESDYALNDKAAEAFFFNPPAPLYFGKKKSSNIVAIIADKQFTDSKSSLTPILAQSDVLIAGGRIRNSKHALASTGSLLSEMGRRENVSSTLVIANAIFDSIYNHRSGKGRIKLDKSLQATREMINLIPDNYRVLLVLPPNLNGSKIDPVQVDVLDKFHDAYSKGFDGSNVELLESNQCFTDAHMCTDYAEILNSKHFKTAFNQMIAGLL